MLDKSSRSKSTIEDWALHDEREWQAVETTLLEANAWLSGITTTAEEGKPSPLEEFVDRCLTAAREELRQNDPTFVARAETQHRLEKTGLHSYESVLKTVPRVRLRKHWHELLEACYDLPYHFRKVKIAASGLDAKGFDGLSHDDAYSRGDFYRSSLNIFLQALAEHVEYMIKCVVMAYLSSRPKAQREKIQRPYIERVRRDFQNIAEGRNRLLHAGRNNATADAITERDFWEYLVVAGDTNPFRVSRFTFEARARNFRLGKWACLEKLADYVCDSLGRALLELDDDLKNRLSKRSLAGTDG